MDGYEVKTSELDFKSLSQQEIHKKNWVTLVLLAGEHKASLPIRLGQHSLNVSNSVLQEWGSGSFCCTNNLSDLLCSTLESKKTHLSPKKSLNHMPSQGQVDYALKEVLWWPWNKFNFQGLQDKVWPYLRLREGYEASATTNKRTDSPFLT